MTFDADAPAMLSPDADLFAIDLSADRLTLIASSSRFARAGRQRPVRRAPRQRRDAFPAVTLLDRPRRRRLHLLRRAEPRRPAAGSTPRPRLVRGRLHASRSPTRVGDTFTEPHGCSSRSRTSPGSDDNDP
jgi:hypothetical protein